MRDHYKQLLDEAHQQLKKHKLTEKHLTDSVVNWLLGCQININVQARKLKVEMDVCRKLILVRADYCKNI